MGKCDVHYMIHHWSLTPSWATSRGLGTECPRVSCMPGMSAHSLLPQSTMLMVTIYLNTAELPHWWNTLGEAKRRERLSDWVYLKAGEGARLRLHQNISQRLLTRILIIARAAPKKTAPAAAAPKKVVAKKISKKAGKKAGARKTTKKVAKKATKKIAKKAHWEINL